MRPRLPLRPGGGRTPMVMRPFWSQWIFFCTPFLSMIWPGFQSSPERTVCTIVPGPTLSSAAGSTPLSSTAPRPGVVCGLGVEFFNASAAINCATRSKSSDCPVVPAQARSASPPTELAVDIDLGLQPLSLADDLDIGRQPSFPRASYLMDGTALVAKTEPTGSCSGG